MKDFVYYCSLSLSVRSLQQPALVAIGSTSTGRCLHSLTLSVIVFYQSALVKVYQEVIPLDEAYSLTLGDISILSACASLNLIRNEFHLTRLIH